MVAFGTIDTRYWIQDLVLFKLFDFWLLPELVNSGLNSCEKSAADNPLFTLYHQEEPHAGLVVTRDDI